jgi:cytochrome c oxidase subunit II
MPALVPWKPLAAPSALLGVGLVFPGLALADNAGFAPVDPRSQNAEGISDTYYLILAFTGAIFLLVEGALIVFVIRFRSRGRGREVEGPQVRGNTTLELAWTVAPVLILAAIGGFVFYKLPDIKNVPAASAAGGERLEISVEGRQFYWQFTYPNGVVAVDQLRVPIDRVVRLKITAPAYDVIHSWWIPALGGKRDAIPGKENEDWFRPTKVGTYRGQCAEFCGIQHAAMAAKVVVLPAQEFDSWLSEEARRQEQGESGLGEATFRGVCAKCHGFEGEGLIAPPIRGAVSDREAVEEIVRNGRGEMPAVGKGWEDRQMDALFAYLKEELGGGR